MTTYLYRRGDGNEGNFPRYLIELSDADDAWAALKACVCNDYIAGKRIRRHLIANLETDGEGGEYGVSAVLYEGPEGEQAFGAAYITAELQPVTEDDRAFYQDRATSLYTLKQVLDASAWRMYRKALRA